MISFFTYAAIKQFIIIFPLENEFTTFFLYYFSHYKFSLICLLRFFFIKHSKNVFSVKVLYNICPWHVTVFLTFLITNISSDQFLYLDISTRTSAKNLGFLSLSSTPESMYTIDLTSIGFILIVL